MDLTPWMASVFVTPEARGRGIGSRLVTFAEEEALKRGVSVLYLFTPNKQRMYARLGWTPIEKVEYRGEHVTIMRKTFSPGLNSAA
jgi:GNAT superfamily N-acetyltransferase